MYQITAPKDPDSGVLLLGREIDYRDSGEAEVARIIQNAHDRSSLSDELRLAAHDWPTTYHLSSARSNLLRPFCWDPSARVVEVGAGCGALTRYLGETGVSVDAIEGNLERARITALRCSGLPGVRVAAGRVEDLGITAEYDVATVIGVLEYSGRYGNSAAGFIEKVARLLKPAGVLVLAIENQLGLKYLMGCVEDHLGRPFAGIGGYEPDEGIRTYSRTVLRRVLERAGFRYSAWFYPFPDYKLPTSILSHDLASDPGCAAECYSVVRTPVLDHVSAPLVSYDTRRALRAWAEAGLLPEIANSFLVVASADPTTLDRFVPSGIAAWQFTDPSRLSIWGAMRTFGRHRTAPGGADSGSNRGFAGGLLEEVRSVRLVAVAAGRRVRGWLCQSEVEPRAFVRGQNLLDTVRRACFEKDDVGLRRILARWHDYVGSHAVKDESQGEEKIRNPFGDWPSAASVLLPGRFLDVNLDNFIDSGSALVEIDQEWSVEGTVPLQGVCMRALWYLAAHMIEWGVHPWEPELTRFELLARLCRSIDLPYSEELMDGVLRAEAELQALITGRSEDQIVAQLRAQGSVVAASTASQRRRIEDLEQDVQRMQRWAESAVRDVEIRDAEIHRLQAVLQQLVERRDAEVAALRDAVSRLKVEKEGLAEEVERLREARASAPINDAGGDHG